MNLKNIQKILTKIATKLSQNKFIKDLKNMDARLVFNNLKQLRRQ